MPTVQKKSNGQFVITIDKSLAEALDLEGGEQASWSVASRSALRLDIEGDSE